MKTNMKIKKKKGRYCCDVDGCKNYAYAEMYRFNKHGWMYVCKKHYKLKLNKKGIPKEKDVGFGILRKNESRVDKSLVGQFKNSLSDLKKGKIKRIGQFGSVGGGVTLF